ncbi:MAG: hypothetical protein HY606_03745, partial [Planctomycetes bacterium]|nr:hypothetical protein [Planctomycetota bacterium]
SGTYPHCTTVPPNLTGVITKIKIYEGQETDYGHLGAITIENAPGKCYPITVIVTENTKFTRPAHPCRTHHGSTTIELKELYNDARISVWFDESKKTKSNSTATIALEVSIWEECD